MVDLTKNPALVTTYGEPFLRLVVEATELSVKDRPKTSAEWRTRMHGTSSGAEAPVAVQNGRRPRSRFLWIAAAALPLIPGSWILADKPWAGTPSPEPGNAGPTRPPKPTLAPAFA